MGEDTEGSDHGAWKNKLGVIAQLSAFLAPGCVTKKQNLTLIETAYV